MNAAELRQAKITARDARLICHHHDFKSGLAKGFYRGGGAGQNADLIGIAQVIDFFDDDPITIEKDGSAGNGALDHGAILAFTTNHSHVAFKRSKIRHGH